MDGQRSLLHPTSRNGFDCAERIEEMTGAQATKRRVFGPVDSKQKKTHVTCHINYTGWKGLSWTFR